MVDGWIDAETRYGAFAERILPTCRKKMVPCGGGGSGAGADSGLTGVDGRACVTVVAGGAVGLGRVWACPGGRGASGGILTLVRSGALNRIPADAETLFAHIGLGASRY